MSESRELIARWYFGQRLPDRYWDYPSFGMEREESRRAADELLARLDQAEDAQ